MFAGPKIIKQDLVWGYDFGTNPSSPFDTRLIKRRFFKGKPTTNLISGGSNRANGVSDILYRGSHAGNATTVTPNYYYSPKRPHTIRFQSTNNTGYHMINQQFSTQNVSGTYYTYSFDYLVIKGNDDTFNEGVSIYGNGYKSPDSGSYASNITTKTVNLPGRKRWKRFSITYQATYTGYNMLRVNLFTGGHNGNNTGDYEVLMDNFKMEQASVPSPFTESSRSSTGVVIDLAKTSTIDVGNLSYDSNGLPYFNGTNSYISTGQFGGRTSTDPFTIEAIVRADSTSKAMMWLDTKGNGSNQRLYSSLVTSNRSNFGCQNKGWSHGTAEDTNYHHQVIVMDGSVCRVYDNGTQVQTHNYTTYNINGNIDVGARNVSNYEWIGEIPVFKIYDKGLTAQEVKKNYRAYKNRFNL